MPCFGACSRSTSEELTELMGVIANMGFVACLPLWRQVARGLLQGGSRSTISHFEKLLIEAPR